MHFPKPRPKKNADPDGAWLRRWFFSSLVQLCPPLALHQCGHGRVYTMAQPVVYKKNFTCIGSGSTMLTRHDYTLQVRANVAAQIDICPLCQVHVCPFCLLLVCCSTCRSALVKYFSFCPAIHPAMSMDPFTFLVCVRSVQFSCPHHFVHQGAKWQRGHQGVSRANVC